MSALNVVDSSGWIEFFGPGPNATAFRDVVLEPDSLIVPTISIYEVFKRIRQQRDEWAASRAVGQMRLGHVVELDDVIAVAAAQLSLRHKLPMADSIILATAQRFDALLWTQDADFAGLDGVCYLPRGKPSD